MAKFSIEKDIAQFIKKTVYLPQSFGLLGHAADEIQFDERRGPTWHCIVGRNFGSFVTHGQFCRYAFQIQELIEQKQNISCTST